MLRRSLSSRSRRSPLTLPRWFLQLMHPVLESLRNTDRQWLIDTLYAFNSGNVETFQALKSAWGQQVSGGVAALPEAWAQHLQSARVLQTHTVRIPALVRWCNFNHSIVMLILPQYISLVVFWLPSASG